MINLKAYKQKQLYYFRMVALTEGISYLLLVLIGMPLKYGLDLPIFNKIIGTIHGILTLVFCTLLFDLWKKEKINTSLSIGVFIASLLPFGAFIADRHLKEKN